MRRLTRLEPPYILALIILFFGVLINGEYTFSQLFPSLMASLVYIHSIIFQGLPKVTTVAWSLEVEIQFYLLTPFLMRLFSLSRILTRTILIALIIVFPLLQNILPTDTNSIYKFFQFFAAGIFFADLYLDKTSILYRFNNLLFAFAGVVLFVLLFKIDSHVSAILPSDVPWENFLNKLVYPFLILGFFMVAAVNPFWKKIMSLKLISIIGTMCYSIYLLHTAIISIFGKYIFGFTFTGNAFAGYFVSLVCLFIIIITISSVFFKFVERPCMEKDWYKKFSFKKYKPLLFKNSAGIDKNT
jgi:peptidoglycan/LPS O-acetylase OafA/YrhL